MDDHLVRIFLPIYFLIYFGITFVAKIIIVRKKIGKNPMVLPTNDTPYGLIGTYFRATILSLCAYISVYSLLPQYYYAFAPIKFLEQNTIQYLGVALLLTALLLTTLAQNNMRTSWRIGIDTNTHTELITDKLFRYSRNPIYLGILLALLGLFALTPNAATLFFLLFGYVLMQIQIRMEEEHLTRLHKQTYTDYQSKTRRWL